MKKGVAEATLYVYGFFLLFCYLLMLVLLSFFGSGFEEKLVAAEVNANKVSLLAYLQTPVEFAGMSINMRELIIHSYYSKDYGLLDEKTREIFGKLYPKKGCLTWNMDFLVDGNSVHEIKNYNGDEQNIAGAEMSMVYEDKKMEVRLAEIC